MDNDALTLNQLKSRKKTTTRDPALLSQKKKSWIRDLSVGGREYNIIWVKKSLPKFTADLHFFLFIFENDTPSLVVPFRFCDCDYEERKWMFSCGRKRQVWDLIQLTVILRIAKSSKNCEVLTLSVSMQIFLFIKYSIKMQPSTNKIWYARCYQIKHLNTGENVSACLSSSHELICFLKWVSFIFCLIWFHVFVF